MERKNLLKSIIVMGLSLMLILSFANYAFADNDLDWDNATVVNSSTNSANSLNSTNVTNTTSNTANSTKNTTNTTNSTKNTTNTTNSTKNTNKVSSNALAYTGSEDIGKTVALVAVVGAIVCVYSYKKIKEYNNI